jgi:hypothetical protein
VRVLTIVYGIILSLGIISWLSDLYILANIAGFIGAMCFLVVFFKEPANKSQLDESVNKYNQLLKKRWYIVCGTGVFFSLVFGSLWNSDMGGII